jgi:hypothetical protein
MADTVEMTLNALRGSAQLSCTGWRQIMLQKRFRQSGAFWLGRRWCLNSSGPARGAGGGIRTHNPVRGAIFETAAYTIPPRRPACQPLYMMTSHARRLPA